MGLRNIFVFVVEKWPLQSVIGLYPYEIFWARCITRAKVSELKLLATDNNVRLFYSQ